MVFQTAIFRKLTLGQLLFLNEFVNRSRISQLKHMADKASFPFDFALFPLRQSSIEVKRSIRLAFLEQCFKEYW